MKYSLSIATIVLLLLLSAASGAALTALTTSNSSSSGDFSIDAPDVYGVNEYTLVEIDEGDNDEEDVITERLFEFIFNTVSAGDVVSWDFGDGNAAIGESAAHSFASPGLYTVTATSTSVDSIQIDTVEVVVEKMAIVESDNM